MSDTHNNVYIEELNYQHIVYDDYVSWIMNDDIVQFTEAQFNRPTSPGSMRLAIQKYVMQKRQSKNDKLFGIFVVDTKKHIGNVNIGRIEKNHKFAELGILIGDKFYHGKGYGTQAIKLMTKYAFDKLQLHKLQAGVYANNMASIKAFTKAGYKECGYFKSHRLYKGQYVDQYLFEIINE